MFRRKWPFLISFAVVAAIAALLASWLLRSPGGREPVRLGYLPITADVPLFVAIEKGFFEREGAKVQAIRFSNANQAMDATLADRTDGAIMLGYSTLFTVFSKSPEAFRVIQSGVETDNKFTARIVVPKDSPIQRIEDLKGKAVGTYSGLTQRLNLVLVLSHFFKNPEDEVHLVQVDQSLQIPSLLSGRFDALFTIDPYATIAITKNAARSISDSPRAKYIVSPFPTCASVLSKSFIEKRPQDAVRVQRAMNTAIDWIERHPNEAAMLTANSKYTDVPADIAQDCGTYEWWRTGEEVTQPVQTLADLMHQHGILKTPIRVADMFIVEPLKQ